MGTLTGSAHLCSPDFAIVNPCPPSHHRLDVYVWDYLTRRGFNGAAKTLVSEAQMNEPPDVPLKTPQGLLFE